MNRCHIHRRDLLKLLAVGGGSLAMPRLNLYAASEYDGRFLISIQAQGGWDVTSFCDPKVNTPGELEINHWANHADIEQAGELYYAPFGRNSNLFGKYHSYMLVINGVDAQTNSHTTGVVHNLTGRLALGYPTLTALFAARYGIGLPLAYVSNNHAFSQGAGLIRYTGLGDPETLVSVLQPNQGAWWEPTSLRSNDDISRIRAAQLARLQRLENAPSLMPHELENIAAQIESITLRRGLDNFLATIQQVPQFHGLETLATDLTGQLRQQVQLSLLAFSAGVACAADLAQGGFDTHGGENDLWQNLLLTHTADGIDYLWTFAEELGIADRITIMLSSDFSRTPNYNSGDGKDHWPIGSVVLMEKNPPWGNRVVGVTDAQHNAFSINPETLQRDDSNGTIIYPKHVHRAVRNYLGIEGSSVESNFPLNTEAFDLFNPALSTPQLVG